MLKPAGQLGLAKENRNSEGEGGHKSKQSQESKQRLNRRPMQKRKKVTGEEKVREEKPEPEGVEKRSSWPEQDLWL